MNLTIVQLTECLQLLDNARRISAQPGEGSYCKVARKDLNNATFRIERKPHTKTQVGDF